MELIPERATFAPGRPIGIELEGTPAGVLRVSHLGRVVGEQLVRARARRVELAPVPEGGYGVDLEVEGRVLASTAFDVLADPFERPRYGFVADFSPGRRIGDVTRHFRRLHLNLAQFYDWGYRHAQLVGPEETYADPLGQRVSMRTVRRLTGALADHGTLPLGYAAVYAVGAEEWSRWSDAGLYHPDGSPYRLGEDFLLLVDPADPRWSRHFTAQLRAALEHGGFAGFHLDQYGWPKRALRADGTVVDLSESFPTLLRRVAKGVPGARNIFNNVNDFPTWTTAPAPQAAAYIEVWPPHTTLGHLAQLVATTRGLRKGQAPILAAYLPPFGSAPETAAAQAARLTMATVFSHGGTHLLAGEAGSVLTDPYYPRNHRVARSTSDMLRRWYDFLVRHGDVLLDRQSQDVTGSFLAGINEEVAVLGAEPVPVSTDPEAGAVWARVVRTTHGTVVHLINLTDQDDTVWEAPKKAPAGISGMTLRLLPVGSEPATAFVADPDGRPGLHPAGVRRSEGHDLVRLPRLRTWQMVYVPDRA